MTATLLFLFVLGMLIDEESPFFIIIKIVGLVLFVVIGYGFFIYLLIPKG